MKSNTDVNSEPPEPKKQKDKDRSADKGHFSDAEDVYAKGGQLSLGKQHFLLSKTLPA